MLGYQEVFRLDMAWNKAIGGFSLVALLIFISYHFVDIGLASFILDILGPSFLQSDQVSNMVHPDNAYPRVEKREWTWQEPHLFDANRTGGESKPCPHPYSTMLLG